MKINRQELLDAVTLLMPGINKQGIWEQAMGFLYFNKTKIYSNNLSINVSLPFITPLNCGIPATEFFNLLQAINDVEIEINEEENAVSIKTKKTLVSMNKIKDENNLLVSPSTDIWKKLPTDFTDAIEFCKFSVATDVLMGALSCIFVKDKIVLSCDNTRATRFEMKSGIGEELLIPLSAANEIKKYTPIEYVIDRSFLFFKNDRNIIFGCLTTNELYKEEEIDSIFKIKNGKELRFPNTLKESLVRIGIFAEVVEKRRFATVKIGDNKITCESVGNSGKIIETGRIRMKETIEFKISIAQLSEILDRTQQAVLSEKVILFTGENFQHVLALIKEKGKPHD